MALTLLAALVVSACAPQREHLASTPAAEPDWAFEASDLPVDPAYRFGKLANGMRYIIRQNATPAGTALVRMEVATGSLNERAGEEGYAHFVEHMAFNGSANVPEGEMVRLLERNGLAFGADTNAQTSFERTTYMLDLPRAQPALLDTALMLMRETVSGLLFDPEAVNRERGVVLSELRDGRGYQRDNLEDQLAFAAPEALFTKRLPIGTPESLNAATAESLRAFWAREYVPARTTLVIVGDLPVDRVGAALTARFADWQPRPPAPRPGPGRVDAAMAGLTDVFIDPALSERVTVSRHGAWLDEPDTVARRRTNVLRQVAYGIINRRLQRLTREASPPFRGAGFGTAEVFEIGRTTNLIVDAEDGKWRRALATAATEYRRAMRYGFTQAEVAEQVANIRASTVNAARAAPTRSHATLVGSALALIREDVVPTSPDSALARFEALAPHITPEAALAAMREEAVPLDNPLIRFQGRRPPNGGAPALRAAWNEAQRAALAAPKAVDATPWTYTDFGPHGTVVADRVDPRLGIRELRFANNVRLNLRRTALERDRVRVSVAIDGGELLNTRERPLATAMLGALREGGLGRYTEDQLQSILAGRSVSYGLGATGDALVASATTTPQDLELQLQLMTALVADPGYRPEGEGDYRVNMANFFKRLRSTPDLALANSIGGILSDNDTRFTIGNPADYQAQTFARLREAIGDRLAKGAIEIAIVGDFEEAGAIDLVAHTFGALPDREADFRPYTSQRQRNFTHDRTLRIIRHQGPSNQAIVRYTWPTRDASDGLEALRLDLLDRVISIEITEGIREKLGKSYSPSAISSTSWVYTGYGTFAIAAAVDVVDLAPTREAILAIIAENRARPVSEDVLRRARQPLLEEYENAFKSNALWMSLVDRAQTQSERIDDFLAARARLLAITAGDLRDLAARYLDPAQAVPVIVLPEGATTSRRGLPEAEPDRAPEPLHPARQAL